MHSFYLALFGINLQLIEHWMAWGGYGILFGVLFACGLGFPCPEDIPLIISGLFISQGKMQLALAAPIAWLGIVGGDCVLYTIGKRLGREVTKLPMIGRHVTHARLDKVEGLFERYGIMVVAIGRLFAGIRGAMVVAAGTSRFRFSRFIVADSLAAILSGGMFMAVGYWCGENLHAMRERLSMILTIVGVAGAIALAVYIYVRSRKARPDAGFDVIVPAATAESDPSTQVVPKAQTSPLKQ